MICSVRGCGRATRRLSGTLCSAHQERVYRCGDVRAWLPVRERARKEPKSVRASSPRVVSGPLRGRCPRCGGLLISGLESERSCMNCGCVVYA